MKEIEKNISCLSKLCKRPFLLMILVIVLFFMLYFDWSIWRI